MTNQWLQLQNYLQPSLRVFLLLCQNNKSRKILKICWQGQTAHTASRPKNIYTRRKNGKEKNSSSPPTNPLESDPPTPSSIWITCSLLKGPSPGRSGGGDTPNEDEYSAAFERLLEGCPARTRCSSQIDGTVRVEGGARRAGLKWRSWMVGAGGGGVGGWSGDDWGGRQTEEACVPVCPSGKWAESNACLHTHTCGNRHSTAQESQEWGRRLLTYCGK